MTLNPQKTPLRTRQITFVSDIPTRKLTEFWTRLEKGEVNASKCHRCGNTSFPPVADCSRCLNSEQEWIKLEGKGQIETFTHISIRPASFTSNEPYTVAVARMKEGVKVLAWVTDAKPSDVKVGSKVKLVAKNSEYGPSYAFTLSED